MAGFDAVVGEEHRHAFGGEEFGVFLELGGRAAGPAAAEEEDGGGVVIAAAVLGAIMRD